MESGLNIDSILSDIYYNQNSPACYSGARNVYNEAKKQIPGIKFSDVEKFFESQDTYTLHKPIRRNFKRNKTVASGIDSDWQADLCDMFKVKKFNKNHAYILTVIDVFSKFAWAEPLINKKPESVVQAFKKIVKESGRKPWRLLTDKGKEFVGGPFQKLLKDLDIKFIQTESPDVKAAVAERYNRTLKTRLWKYFTKNSTYHYLDVLPNIVKAINHSYHRSIKRRPVDVNYKNAPIVWETLYGDPFDKKIEFKFDVGDKVRIAQHKHIFKKGYLPTFTQEIFTVAERLHRNPPVYRLVDYNKEPISGVFYEFELVKTVKPDEIYKIEKILRRRKKNNKTEYFVKWLGYPDKFNQWIQQSDLTAT